MQQEIHGKINIRIIECALCEFWLEINRESLIKLNKTIDKRLVLCIKNKRGAVKY
jgi:hypothetical protein